MFAVEHTKSTVLCCLCGTCIEANPANMCVNCLRSQVRARRRLPLQWPCSRGGRGERRVPSGLSPLDPPSGRRRGVRERVQPALLGGHDPSATKARSASRRAPADHGRAAADHRSACAGGSTPHHAERDACRNLSPRTFAAASFTAPAAYGLTGQRPAHGRARAALQKRHRVGIRRGGPPVALGACTPAWVSS
jgi:hypothetical protein